MAVSRETVRLAGGGRGSFGEGLTPTEQVGRAFIDLQASFEALARDPENDGLHGACDAKLAQFARLTGVLELAPEIRKEARRYVMDATRWLASMAIRPSPSSTPRAPQRPASR